MMAQLVCRRLERVAAHPQERTPACRRHALVDAEEGVVARKAEGKPRRLTDKRRMEVAAVEPYERLRRRGFEKTHVWDARDGTEACGRGIMYGNGLLASDSLAHSHTWPARRTWMRARP